MKMGAFNLVRADLNRARKSKLLIVMFCITVGLQILGVLASTVSLAPVTMWWREMAITSGQLVHNIMLGSHLFMILMVATIVSFNGNDFSFNTIRNKIIAGNSRTKVFLSQIFVNLVIFSVMYIATAFTSVILLTAITGYTANIGVLFARLFLGYFAYLALVSFITFVTMIIGSKPKALIALLIPIFILPQILLVFSIIPDAIGSSGGWLTAVTVLETTPFGIVDVALYSPHIMLQDMFRVLYWDGYYYHSYGTEFSMFYMPAIADAIRVIVASTLYSGAFIGFGILAFNKKNIK